MFRVVGTVGSMKVGAVSMSVSVGAANSSGVGTVLKVTEGVGAVQSACVGAKGKSILRNIYPISRGYEDIAERLNGIGADIKVIKEI